MKERSKSKLQFELNNRAVERPGVILIEEVEPPEWILLAFKTEGDISSFSSVGDN
jgi:hypothetical protein